MPVNEQSVTTQSGHGFDSRQLHFYYFCVHLLNILPSEAKTLSLKILRVYTRCKQ